MLKLFPRLIIFLGMILLSACSFAPKFERPPMEIPEDYKEAGNWLPAHPDYADKYRGPWWQVYQDPKLNALEEKLSVSNQNLKIACARFQEAEALLGIAHADFYPQATGIVTVTREHDSKTVANPNYKKTYNNFFVGINATYEVDLWGKIHNAYIASMNKTRATAADLAAADLSLHAELASDYFYLRGADRAIRVLEQMVVAYQEAQHLIEMRHQGGAAPIYNVYQAQTQTQNAQTQLAAMRLRRARYEHAIAILIGEVPAHFNLLPNNAPVPFITIAPDLPSTLLERRPDIASAERKVEAANAQIGVARAAFYPDLNLSTTLGFQSSSFGRLFSLKSLFWAIGPPAILAFVQPTSKLVLFDGWRLHAQLALSKAKYRETVAYYRQTVLNAFQEIEDNLAAIRQLTEEYETQNASVLSSGRTLVQAQLRYRGGIVTYLDVVVSENLALQAQLNLVDIWTQRHIASVQLIRALGGGFEMGS